MEGAHRLDLWLYRGGRPNRLARLLNGVSARLGAAGIGPERLAMLQVTGRRTGRMVSLPVVVADYLGERYLVSMLGDNTSWVRNVRAAGGRAVLRRGRPEVVQLEEVEPAQRGGILRRYLECAPGARPHVPVDPGAPVEQFEHIAARYPVFRVQVVNEQANRETVRRAFEAWRRGDAPITDVFAPDMTWRIEGRSVASREYRGRQEFIDEVLAPFGARFSPAEPFRPVTIRGLYADGDTVVVVWDGRGKALDGRPYENSYAWILRLREGKVVDGTAFYDSISFNDLFIRVAPRA